MNKAAKAQEKLNEQLVAAHKATSEAHKATSEAHKEKATVMERLVMQLIGGGGLGFAGGKQRSLMEPKPKNRIVEYEDVSEEDTTPPQPLARASPRLARVQALGANMLGGGVRSVANRTD